MVHADAPWIAGIDGCKGGWIVVSHRQADRAAAKADIFKTFAEVCDYLPRGALIGVDMPIGLPDHVEAGGRAPDRAARLVLGPRRSSVFSVPSRAAIYAFSDGYPKVCAVARATSTPSWAPSKQAFWLFPRIQEIDRALRADPDLANRVFEIHPEVSFATMQAAPLGEPKKKNGRCHTEGISLRKTLLMKQNFPAALVDQVPPRGAGLDDLLDACAVAWSAARIKNNEALVFPHAPVLDIFGLKVAIWA
jgi:predicted RNase H-like nuclease